MVTDAAEGCMAPLHLSSFSEMPKKKKKEKQDEDDADTEAEEEVEGKRRNMDAEHAIRRKNY
jgi:hypothetical protein